MASTAEELLIIARLKNETKRGIGEIRADQRALRAEIDKTGTASKTQSADMRRLQREYDATSVRLGALGKHLSDVGARMTRRVTFPLLVGFGLATKAALDDAKSQVVLANTMRNTEHATSGQIKAQEAWIRRTQFASGVSDNVLRPALGRLELSHRSVTQAQSDVNIAMDVAVARNMDLGTVVQAFSKAANGQTQGLQRLGIQTKDASGHALTYDQILQRLAKTTGGSWAAAADTTAGKLARTQERMREFGEDIGNRLIPIVDRGAQALSGMFDWFGHFGAAGQDLFIFGGLALAAVGPVIRLAGGILQMAKAYREWQAARAAGAAVGIGGEGIGLLGGLGLGGALAVGGTALVVGGLAIGAGIQNAGQADTARKRAAAHVARLMGAGGLPGASFAQRAAGLSAAQADLARLRAGREAHLRSMGISPSAVGPNQGYENRQQQAEVAALEKTIAASKRAQQNIGALSASMHMSRAEVVRLAEAHGVDLSGSLKSVSADMKEATAQAKANGEAISDQAAKYKALTDAIDGVRNSRDRLVDRFLDFKQSGLDFASATEAYRTAKTPREKQAAEIALFRSGESYLDAASKAGKYGPSGLTQVGFAANLQELLKPALQGTDPAGLAAVARQYLSDAVSEDGKSGQLLQGARNQFTITQQFYGAATPALVAAAAQSGFDAASKAAAHTDTLVKRL